MELAVGEDVQKTLLDYIQKAEEVPLGQIEMFKIHFLDKQLNAVSTAGEYELAE